MPFRATRAGALALGLAALATACDRPPDVDVKEWAPGDHDRIEDKQRAAQGAAPGAGGAPQAQSAEQLIEATWRQQCAMCHGAVGKGDGPQAPMFKPADLTREEWQSKVTDDEIVAIIKNGKGKMPKFEGPDPIVRGLVARIRFYRGK